jgi:general secretion pathway protein C
MTSRLLSLLVWALVAGTGAFWGLKLFAKGAPLAPAVQMPPRASLAGELTTLLGDSTPPDAEEAPDIAAGSDRFRLIGVVAPVGRAASAQGVALIAIGDQPAKVWKTGSVIEGDLVLLSVGQRSAQIGPRGGPASSEISLPPLAPAATGPVPGPGGSPAAKVGLPIAGAVPGAPFYRVPGTPQGTPPPGVLPQPAPAKADDDEE